MSLIKVKLNTFFAKSVNMDLANYINPLASESHSPTWQQKIQRVGGTETHVRKTKETSELYRETNWYTHLMVISAVNDTDNQKIMVKESAYKIEIV